MVHSAMSTHCNQYASGFRRGALHGKPRRVERRVARESADLRGGRHVSRTAALNAADPTESYAPGKSHEITRCTPYPVSILGRITRNDTLEPRNTRHLSHTVCRGCGLCLLKTAGAVEQC